jgi:tRNA(adenine34) deaminase
MDESQFSDEFWMKKAFALARQAGEEGEVPIGAIVVLNGEKLIAKGYNQTEKLNDVSAHAEMLALTAAAGHLGGKYLMDCTLYVTIEPCPMCAAALNWAQLGTLVYAAPDVKRGYSLFRPSLLHPKTTVRQGILVDECGNLVKSFFEARRKKNF